jgi:transposase InsO family protein
VKFNEKKGVKPMKKRGKSSLRGKQKRRPRQTFSPEFKLKVVRLYLEEGYKRSLIAQEFNIAESSVGRWSRQYRRYGEQGLQPKSRPASRAGLSEDVKERIIELKQSNPSYGTRRISDVLKRFFLIRTSPSTVRKTLSEEGLITKQKSKPRKNPSKPRFFERSRPNQLWQSDIMTFRLAGRNAYLIGFQDDYSRYITSLGLYRSQTAAHVLETYRRGIAEYGVPREMLTDNGRQYTNWRGKTRFEREMKKDRVNHIKSRPHHPMTLGKIERFWKSIQDEYLFRAQFDSFEQAVERTAYWVKYYNYKRPHQGIGGLCPADRFFEIQHELKHTLEKGVEENALELALRGRPVDPFYMVGRMGDQSVVIRAEKGKVKMLVDGQEQQTEKELVYDVRKDIKDENSQTYPQNIRSRTEDYGRFVDLDGTPDVSADLPGAGHQCQFAGAVAEPGHRGNAQIVGSDEKGSLAATQPSALAADRKEAERFGKETGSAAQGDPEDEIGRHNIARDGFDEETPYARTGSPAARRGDHESSLRSDERQPGSQTAGDLQKNVLQVGTTRSQCVVGWPHGSIPRPSDPTGGQREGGVGKAAVASPPGQRTVEAPNGPQGCFDGFETRTRHEPGEKKMNVSKRP